jgi:DNA-binding CsgD family transcriptional regulator
LLRALDAFGQVHHRAGFFNWTQAHLGALVPHDVLAWQRGPDAQGDAPTAGHLHSRPLDADTLEALCRPATGGLARLAADLQQAHPDGHARPSAAAPACWPRAGGQPTRPLGAGAWCLPPTAPLGHGLFYGPGPDLAGSGHVALFTLKAPFTAAHAHAVALLWPQLVLGAQRAAAPTQRGAAPSLTALEQRLLAAMAAGLPNRAIADETGVSLQTVKNALSRVYRKLGVVNRVQALVCAQQRGLPCLPALSNAAMPPDEASSE